MKTSELREMDKTSLEKELLALLQEQFSLRMQKAIGQLKQTHLIAIVKRNVAKVKTVLGEK